MLSNLIIIAVLFIFLNSLCGTTKFKIPRSQNILVQTTKGWVIGRERKTINLEKPYVSFSGIPYAAPPVEDLRFSAPLPTKSWFIKDATKEGHSCVLAIFGNEDCLNLNVYVPQVDATETEDLPVIVFIHGGFFIAGDGGYEGQAPDYLLEENIIFVSINYRLGVFGFLSTEDDSAYGNWALKDQILALQWVQENIKSFGGNKNNVTIMGQSAGGACVNYLLQTQKTKNFFQKAIMQSGSVLNIWAFTREPRNISFLVGRMFGIYTEDSKELVKQLRQVDASKLSIVSSILNIVLEIVMDPKEGLVFSPTKEPEHEGAVITGQNYENLKTGNFNKVPVIIGFVSQEGYTIYQWLEFIRPYLLIYDLFDEKVASTDMNINETDKKAAGEEIKQKCFGNSSVLSSKLELSQYITEDQFVRPVVETARLMAKFTEVYLYRFSYMGEGKVENGTGTGVVHGLDLTYLFYYDYIANRTATDILTRQRMVKLWTTFAKTSYPILDVDLNPENVTWPQYKEKGTYLDIGENLTLKTDLDKYRIDWWKYIFDKYGNPPFNTY